MSPLGRCALNKGFTTLDALLTRNGFRSESADLLALDEATVRKRIATAALWTWTDLETGFSEYLAALPCYGVRVIEAGPER